MPTSCVRRIKAKNAKRKHQNKKKYVADVVCYNQLVRRTVLRPIWSLNFPIGEAFHLNRTRPFRPIAFPVLFMYLFIKMHSVSIYCNIFMHLAC